MADVVNLQPPPAVDDPVSDFAAALRGAGQRGELPRGKPRQPVFAPSAPMPGVVPPSASTMAMDSAVGNSTNWAADQLLAAYYADGMSFLGYPLLAELAQRGEYRRLSEVIATEMTREWIELKSSSDEDKSLEINAINDEIKRLGVQDAFRRLAEQDGFFGRAHLYIDLGTTDTPDELKTPIGHGRDLISQAKIRKGGLKALRTVEAVWTYPIDYNASDPLRADWYKPQSWFVMGKMIHATRLLTLVGREVPDLLKPAYMFGGLPLSQMAKTYIDKWTQTRDAVADLIRSFSTSGVLTDLTAMLNNGGQQIVENRADLYNFFRDNRGLMILNKETEEFFNVSIPLAGLDALQAQSQEHICSISGLPLIKYTGLTPSGLNASSEGEIRSFYDWIAAYQELLFREPLTRVIDFIQLSRLGRVDPDITFDFKSLWQLDEAGKASVQATKADIHSKYEEMGAVSNEEVRRILATDPESPYIALELDPNELPVEPPAPPMAGAGQPALGGPPRPPGGGPHQGAVTSVTSPFGATRDPASGRQSLAAHRAGDMALDQEAPVPLDPDLLEIARGAPSNIIQQIYGLQAERDRRRSPFDQAEWEESKHRREAHGRFTSGGGGSGTPGVHQHVPGVAGIAAQAVAAARQHLGEFARPEAHVIHQALQPGGAARKSWASKVASMAKNLPQHIWHEEKTHAVHAAGGLKAMATGNRPTPEQMKGLRSFGLRMAMSGGSMLLTGDPTGTVAHAAVMLAQEIVQHVIIEHGAKLGIGMARAAVGGGDAAPDDTDDLTPEDIARLQAFLEDLAEAIANYDPEAEAKKKAPLTGDAKWLADWFAEDAEWKEEEHTRKHGQFAKKGEGEAGAKKEEPAEKEEPEAEEPSKKPEAEPPSEEPGTRKEPARGRPAEPAAHPRRTRPAPLAALPEPYTRRRGSLGRPSRLRPNDAAPIRAIYQPGDQLKAALAAIGAPALTYHELDKGSGTAFANAITKSKEGNKFAASVHAYSPEEYEGMKLFTTPDGKVGFALHGDDIVSAFRAQDGPKHAVPSMLALAVKEGGRRLDAFDTVLPEMYSDNGFKAVARLPFDPTQAPEGWDTETFKDFNNGRPDVVFMTYDPNHAHSYQSTEGTPITDYDQGQELQRQALANTGLPGSQGHPALISSRRPTAAGYVEGDHYRRADLDAMRADPANFEQKMNILRNPEAYPNFRPEDVSGSPDQIAKAAIEHAVQNLTFLYTNAPQDVREQGPQWYESANRMAQEQATKYGLPLQTTAGVYAALSPQKVWDENVYLANRVIAIHQTKQHEPWDNDMQKVADRIWTTPANKKALALVQGKRLDQLTTPTEKALWIRTYDEAHSDRHFDQLSADGRSLGMATKIDPTDPEKKRRIPAQAAWQGLDAIGSAVQALDSGGNRDVISDAMGDRHKVRSFYDNILDPHSKNDDVTMDTHAVGAALLRALSGKTAPVMHSLALTPGAEEHPPGWQAAGGSSVTGVQGLYGLWADAYREAARQLHVEPRVLQSVTWEAKRRLFSGTSRAAKAGIEGAWHDYHDGKRSLEDTQQEVLRLAGGFKTAAEEEEEET